MKNRLCMSLFLFFCWTPIIIHAEVATCFFTKKPKVLHLTFHAGCAKEIEVVAKELGLELTTWNIQKLPPGAFDGITKNNAIYNIGHDRAKRIWNLHQEFFNSFDLILTSDTAPLSRIFLQNGWKKPLIIWVCNRFDYYDGASLDCDFPDAEYYRLFKQACTQENVTVIGYTAYENRYAKLKGIDIGDLIIKPSGKSADGELRSAIPAEIIKSKAFFLPPYHNETIFMNASAYYSEMGIENYCGRYNGAKDLEGFRGIIHLPYAWSNLALFENMYLSIPYLIPSEQFMQELICKSNYFFTSDIAVFRMSEWYAAENASYFIYFDSWEDLVFKLNTVDFVAQRSVVKRIGVAHAQEMFKRWKKVFENMLATFATE